MFSIARFRHGSGATLSTGNRRPGAIPALIGPALIGEVAEVTGSDAWLPAAIQTTPGLQPKDRRGCGGEPDAGAQGSLIPVPPGQHCGPDRKSTRLNSSH